MLYTEKLADQFQNEIEAVQWPWTSRQTRRRNGQLAGSPRDIVDTGQLRDSQQAPVITTNKDGLMVFYQWTAPYAYIVLGDPNARGFGGAVKANYPARNWINLALKKLPMEPFIAKGLLT